MEDQGGPSKGKTSPGFAKRRNPVEKIARKISGVADAAANAARKNARSFRRSTTFDKSMMYADEAEDTVLSNVEQRAKYTQMGEDGFRPAVKGELPPLRVPNLGVLGDSIRDSQASSRRSSVPSIHAALHQHRKELAALRPRLQSTGSIGKKGGHRRAQTLLLDIDKGKGPLGFHDSSFGFNDYTDIDKPFGDPDNNTINSNSENEQSTLSIEEEEIYPGEGLPLLSSSRMTSERRLKARKLLEKSVWKKAKELLNPAVFASDVYSWFIGSTFMISIPIFTIAFILYYILGNPPTPDYIPGDVTFYWWFDFIGRQLVTLEIARLSQTLFMCLVLTSKTITHALGPWLTILFIQSRGWPFILTAWSFWDLVLLEGNSKFDLHWFYFTGLKIFNETNSGAYILSSEYYLRILFSMILAGIASSLKSTVITLYFGRRMVATYKPKLEEILKDIITITDVAELAIESDKIADVIGMDHSSPNSEEPSPNGEDLRDSTRRRGRLSVIRWSDIKFQPDSASPKGSETNEEFSLPSDDGEPERIDLEFETEGEEIFKSKKLYGSSVGSRFAMRTLLDKWDEPEVKGQKTYNVSVDSIMKFRQALRYMNLDYPFSESFGLASTRNEMIMSAETVYKRLMKLSPDPEVLNFSAFDILTLNEDGSEDEVTKKRLVNVFHPDTDGSIQLLAFVQACDTLYRKLRLFRASVGNSSVIDGVLESIIDPVFFLCLGTIILYILDFNPIGMLIPLSSLLVAGSFAFGSTCAKAFEGIILIIGRRPYGIGDRIVIQDSAGADVPSMAMSWIVEDISLLSTTLRFGATNEIAQVSNGSISNARITNCNRSEKATIHILLSFHMSCLEGTRTMERFKEGVEEYIRENRNTWDSIFFFRCESINPNTEEVVYKLSVRSTHTWQVSNRVYRHQGELFQFCTALAFKLRINYDSPNNRSIVYYGGTLDNGGVEDYKSRVLKNSNIVNNGEDRVGELINRDSVFSKMSKEDSVRILGTKKKPAMKMDDPRHKSLVTTKTSFDTDGNASSDPALTDPDEMPWNDQDRAFLSMLQGSQM